MADDGAELSLDDYIKVKRKQGAFKVGRGGGGVKFQTRRIRKEIRANKNVRQQPRAGNQGSPKKNRGSRGGRAGRGRYFASNVANNAANNFVPRGANPRRGRGGLKNWSGYRQNQNRRQMAHPLVINTNFQRGQGPRGYQNRNNNRGYGFSQNLVRQARQRLRFNPSSVIQRAQPRNYLRVGPRPNNRKVVMKLVRKRVQRARLQLNRQGRLRGLDNRRRTAISSRMLPLLSVTSGIRRTRTGFVTVSNPVEKQLQRLVVKEKIQRAHQVKGNRALNYSLNNPFSPTAVPLQPRQGREQSDGYRQQLRGYRQPQQSRARQHIMPLMNFDYQPEPTTTYQQPQRHHPVIVRNNNDSNSRASLNQNQRSIPAMGRSMYADQEEAHRMQFQHTSGPFTTHFPRSQNQQQWMTPASSNPFAIRRTTVNNMYDPTHPAIDYEELPHGLNADIQRKINFIQNHGNRSDTLNEQRGGPREIIPDFRGPVSSSNMKLGDRFKMYMH